MWFNTAYYHLLYQHRDYTEAELFINSLAAYCHFEQLQPAQVLDLACGKGRHSLYLAQKFPFLNVWGVDLAADSITAATLQAQELGLKNCHFGVQDILAPIANYGEFGCILNLFTSFGYFDTDDLHLQILKNVQAALAENGLFVLDFMNVDKVINNLVPADFQQVGNVNFSIERRIEQGFIRKYIRVEDARHQAQPVHFQEQVKIYRLADFERFFAVAGLKIKAVFGDYNLNPFDVEKSPRLILLAQK